jgi:tRNA threonylcarbamoyladenosine biosynthesis protein TsaB
VNAAARGCDNRPMRILALDTATEACSVALWLDGAILERFEIAPRRHAALVLPMADALLAEAGIGKRQLDGIAVGRGPGAFTGIRLAIAVAQGLGVALDRPLLPVSTLASLAMGLRAQALPILALIDARMGEVYAGAFAPDADGLVTPIGDEAVLAPDRVVAPGAAFVGIGTGFGAFPQALQVRFGGTLRESRRDALPHAADLARLAARDLAAGRGVDPLAAQPFYLRDKVALTLAEQGKPTPAGA